MKKLMVITSIFLMGGNAFGQQLNVKVLSDDPTFSNLAIRPAFTVDMGLKEGWGMGLGVTGEYNNENLPVQLTASFRQNLIGSQNIDAEAYAPLRGIELGAAYRLVNKTKKKNLRVVLKATEVSSTTTNITYVNQEGSVNSHLLGRAGLYIHRSNWSSGDVITPSDISINNVAPLSMKGTINASGVYVGIASLKRYNLQIETDEYGTSVKAGHSQIYLDLLFTPSVDMGEWTDVNGEVGAAGTIYSVDDEGAGVEVSNLGLRFGWLYNPVHKQGGGGWFFRLETGSRPSYKGQGLFFVFAVGFAINN